MTEKINVGENVVRLVGKLLQAKLENLAGNVDVLNVEGVEHAIKKSDRL